MKTIKLATFLLSTAFILAPGLTTAVYAHDGEHGGWESADNCTPHPHFTDTQIQLLHQTMEAMHEKNKQAFDNLHKLHDKLHVILSSPTFDRQAFLTVTAQIDKLREHLKHERVEAFAAIADQFTPEEREHLIRIFGHHHHGTHHEEWRHDARFERGHHEHGDGEWRDRAADGQGSDMNGNQASRDYPPYSQH